MPKLAERPSPSALPAEESERRLVEASGKYMRGEISADAFEEAERRYMTDYRSVLSILAKDRKSARGSRLARSITRT